MSLLSLIRLEITAWRLSQPARASATSSKRKPGVFQRLSVDRIAETPDPPMLKGLLPEEPFEEFGLSPVIFLDFDGVLNRVGARYPSGLGTCPGEVSSLAGFTGMVLEGDRWAIVEDTLVARVRDLVRTTGAQVVVSSDWRTYLSLGDFVALLKMAGWPDPPVRDTTDPKMAYALCPRFEEVADWLRRNGEPEAWVALDDRWGDPEGDLGYPVVRVDPHHGLQPNDAKWALEALQGQLGTSGGRRKM